MKKNRFPVSVSPFCLAVPVLFFLLFPPTDAVSVAAAVLCHEGGHLLACRLTGVRIVRLRILPFGAEIVTVPAGPRKSALIALAGGLCNLACAAVTFRALPVLCAYSLVFACGNLLPVTGLDGGVCLSELCCAYLEPARAQAVCRAVSGICLFCLWVCGCWMLLCTGNVSLFALCCFLFCRSFLPARL